MKKVHQCFVCGQIVPIGWGKYCSDACKQKAYRERKREKELGAIGGISSMLISIVGERASEDIFDKCNAITGKENQLLAAHAIEIAIYAFQNVHNTHLNEALTIE